MVTLCLAEVQLFRPEPGRPVGAVNEKKAGGNCCLVVAGKHHVLAQLLDDLYYGVNDNIRFQSSDSLSEHLKPGSEFIMIEGVRQIGIGTIKA